MSGFKKISHILAALFLALAAGGLVWYYVRLNTPGVRVVVASERLAMGTVLGPKQVALKDYPPVAVPEEAETSLQSVLGKTVVSGTVFPGEVIRKGHITADTGSLKAALNILAPGREAVDLPAETSTGLRGIAVGDRVNVFTEITIGKDTTAVDCVAREAVVVRVPLPAPGRDSSLAAPASRGAYVIAVTPEEARKVAEGTVRGKRFSISLLPAGGGR